MTRPRPFKTLAGSILDIAASPKDSVNGRFHALGFQKKHAGNKHVFYNNSACYFFASASAADDYLNILEGAATE